MTNNPGKTISIYNINELVGLAFNKAMAKGNILSAFRKTGIQTFNADNFSEDFLMSSVTDRPATAPALEVNNINADENLDTRGDDIQHENGKDNDVYGETTQPPISKMLPDNTILTTLTPQDVKPFPKAMNRKNTSFESVTPKKIRLHSKENQNEVELVRDVLNDNPSTSIDPSVLRTNQNEVELVRDVLNDNPSTSIDPSVLRTYSRKREHKPEIEDFLKSSSSEHSSNISNRIVRMPFKTLSPRCRKLRYKLADLRKQLRGTKIRNIRLSNKKKALTAHSIIENLLRNSTAQVKTTIQEWLQTANLQTGVNTNVVNLLAQKVQTMTALERQVVVLMDEISLKQDLKLNESSEVRMKLKDFRI
ncbi:Transposase protein [Popillia japonica]|uniref:Transposase protein n=1 Tax=Popillia japonica TaxID=7064 RepID=A0AAW1KJP4_POPJA